jgi:hypothetical protein
MMEVSPYQLEEVGRTLGELLELLRSAGYVLTDIATGRPLPMESSDLRDLVPDGASLNALASAAPSPSTPPAGRADR